MKNLHIVALTFAVAFYGYGRTSNAQSNKEVSEVKVIRDIAYRKGSSKAWRLDLAMPDKKAKALHPALVIVHGGGWRGGSKSVDVFQEMMIDYAKKGYVTINVEYRLTGEAPFPACIEDVKCAVRWLRAHAKEYHVDPKRIGAYGHSAGAHLALMLAMAPKSAGLEGDGGWDDYSSRVNVAAGGSPPTELGRDVPMAKSKWWPIGYISADQPPLFLVQGSDDRIVRAKLTDDFVEKMKAKKAKIEYLRVDGARHGLAYNEKLEITAPAIEKFFAKHLKPTLPDAKKKKTPSKVIIEEGGAGPYLAIAKEDQSLPGMTIFRPQDLSGFGAGKKEKLPILLWGNGACANTTQEHKKFLMSSLLTAISCWPSACLIKSKIGMARHAVRRNPNSCSKRFASINARCAPALLDRCLIRRRIITDAFLGFFNSFTLGLATIIRRTSI